MKKFPTKKQFIEWWDNREDVLIKDRNLRIKTCPIARYLKEHDYPYVMAVSAITYNYVNDTYIESMPLPKWAQKFISKADDMKENYRGLPKGFR